MRAPLLRAFAFACVLGSAAAALAGATLVRVDGTVEIGRGAPPVWRAAKVGDAVAAGEVVRTGAGARAELQLGDERTARLYEHSLLRVGPDAGPGVGSLDLDAGASLFDLVRRVTGGGFDVRTPEIIVSVKGTRFLVTANEGPDSTSVFRGEVALAENGFDTISVLPGFTGALGEVAPTPFADPWESWASNATAPTIAIERESEAELRDAVEKARDARELPSLPAALDENGKGKPDGDSDARGNGSGIGNGANVEVNLDAGADVDVEVDDAVRVDVDANGLDLELGPGNSPAVDVDLPLEPVTGVLEPVTGVLEPVAGVLEPTVDIVTDTTDTLLGGVLRALP
ncbi:MAG TPA: FecR family protein [Myxococcota bacterium]|nr:FecR family protein [Myxococcota bacterium]